MFYIFVLQHKNLNISFSLLFKTKQLKHEKVDHLLTQNFKKVPTTCTNHEKNPPFQLTFFPFHTPPSYHILSMESRPNWYQNGNKACYVPKISKFSAEKRKSVLAGLKVIFSK